MVNLLLAGAGGFIGSSLRYLLGICLHNLANTTKFPLATLTVNLIGCLIIGFLSQLAEGRGLFTAETRVFIFIGVLGGFTTFSSFGNETVELVLFERGWVAGVNVAGHLVLGLGGVWLGRLLANL